MTSAKPKKTGRPSLYTEALAAKICLRLTRVMLFEPPGHAKSTYASHLFPGWYLGRNPERSVIAASHTAQLATRFGLSCVPDGP